MNAMISFCSGGVGYTGVVCVVWVLLLESTAIISAYPNLLTGDDLSRLINAGRISMDDATRIIQGQATPEELAQLKVDLIQLNSSSSSTEGSPSTAASVSVSASAAPTSPQGQQRQLQHQQLIEMAGRKFLGSSPCDVTTCRNGGVCTTPDDNSKDTTLCVCPKGFYGEFCDYDSPECESEPCLQNGECQRSNSYPRGYKCLCPNGYTGDNCEVTLRVETTTTVAPPVPPPNPWSVSQNVLFRPLTLIILLSIFIFILAMAFVATVEADRKVLTERYRVLISVGYRVEYPRIEFYRLAAFRIRFLCCCLCNMFPCCKCGTDDDDEDEIPLPPLMRGGDPCGQLRSLVQATAMHYQLLPSRQQSQQSLHGKGGGGGGGGVVQQQPQQPEGRVGRGGHP